MNTITAIIPLSNDVLYQEEYKVQITGESVSPESIMLSMETADMISGLNITSNHLMFYPLPFEAFSSLVKAGIKPCKTSEFDYDQLSFTVDTKNITAEQKQEIGISENEELSEYGLLDFFMQFIGYSISDFSYKVLETKRYQFDKGKHVEVSSTNQ